MVVPRRIERRSPRYQGARTAQHQPSLADAPRLRGAACLRRSARCLSMQPRATVHEHQGIGPRLSTILHQNGARASLVMSTLILLGFDHETSLVEAGRLELPLSCLQGRCVTSYTTPPTSDGELPDRQGNVPPHDGQVGEDRTLVSGFAVQRLTPRPRPGAYLLGHGTLEPDVGLEPTPSAWKADMLPITPIRLGPGGGLEPPLSLCSVLHGVLACERTRLVAGHCLDAPPGRARFMERRVVACAANAGLPPASPSVTAGTWFGLVRSANPESSTWHLLG